MSGGEIMTVASFFILLMSTMAGVWWRVESKIDAVRGEANGAKRELDAHKLHVAETYATKQGMQEQTSQLLRAIEGIGHRIEGMNERLDRAFENTNSRRSTRAS